MDQIGVTMPSRTCELSRIPEYAKWADEAGFDSAWSYELYRNPFAMLCTSAMVTKNVKLATGLAASFPRSPFEMANAMMDVDEMSDGRALLGIGGGVPEFLQAFHSTDAKHLVGRMSEYIDVLRAAFTHMHTGEPVEYTGEHYQFVSPPMNPWGGRHTARATIPIHLAAMRPKMMALCGEKADGWIGYLATPKFVEESLIPGLEVGAKKAGRDVSEVDIATEVICCVSPDRDEAYRRARAHVGFYLSHPVSDVVVNLHGLQEEQGALRQALMTKGLAAFDETSEKLIEAFSITGTPDEARQKLDEWKDSMPHLVLHTPYVPPLTAEDSEDAYRQIIDTFADVAKTTPGKAAGVAG